MGGEPMTRERLPSVSGSFFAPPGRALSAELEEQSRFCQADPLVQAVMAVVDSYAVVLNAQRQIIAANPILMESLRKDDPTVRLGRRLGEAFGCVHVPDGPDGCGTSRACRRCGQLLAVLGSLAEGKLAEGECLLSLQREGRWEAREFMARAMPLQVAGHTWTLLTLRDISAEKRRDTLERVFLHDLMSSLQGLQEWMEVLQGAGADATTIAEKFLDLARALTAEVESQRRLLQAESGDFATEIRTVSPDLVLDAVFKTLGAEASSRLIRLPPPPDAALLRTDLALLARILGNMVQNALEAMPSGGHAQIGYELRAGRPAFVVYNSGFIPPEVADQVFQRSFSTKSARGRGMGTYGMKLLGETVLGGRVEFTTSWDEGTRFSITLP